MLCREVSGPMGGSGKKVRSAKRAYVNKKVKIVEDIRRKEA